MGWHGEERGQQPSSHMSGYMGKQWCELMTLEVDANLSLDNEYYIVCECNHVGFSEGGHSSDRDF